MTLGRSPNLSELCFLFVSSEDNKINLRAFPRGLNETMCRTISSLSGFIVALNKYLFFSMPSQESMYFAPEFGPWFYSVRGLLESSGSREAGKHS